MSDTLLVTGATGQLGKLVLDQLLASGIAPARIIATSRDTAKLADYIARGVQARVADFDDPASLDQAFAGADRILIISTDALDQPGKRLKQHLAAVAAAKKAGAKHIVYTSMPSPETSVIPFAPDHLGTENAIKATGIPYTILRNGWYMENLFMALPHALETGQWYSSSGEGRLAHIARGDAAKAAAAALAASTSESHTYTLTGGELRSTDEIAALVAKATGKSLNVVHISDEALAGGLKSAGLPDFLIPIVVSFDANTRGGHIDMVTGDVTALTGATPVTLAAFLEASKARLAS
ncbi:SDR family oxidoreductase [Ensifer sp. ENS07]|jgi:NAD(P)H dehydrogenase (quinone)|uniref:SDR family oxidoreductase n=1 Tax=Ensifer adhaerens TaxID=106592 RepID=A0A9Q9D8A7_ENSAD|nr:MULTISPECIES: SDR family oxidoreductase [Ensifer]KSV74259.1 nucleoside-diphosphate sugar epimerase [Sinorhizobium sp. GL2]KQX60451.1 NAD(P)-dependent oxidoreductase [Ensifer sp. Root1298]KQX94153.1 NAD(P)-dependent oxidoreductase [Ensifer sp. Root1312]KRC29846.1 NAD(P)-dependent oxidoreductase [Ensifer sp. Root74]KRD66372.1 NAD(P)-dependent oxidoreductase [Ensifer sp. Root954]